MERIARVEGRHTLWYDCDVEPSEMVRFSHFFLSNKNSVRGRIMGDRVEKANKSQFQRCLILLFIDAYSGVFKEKNILFVFVC